MIRRAAVALAACIAAVVVTDARAQALADHVPGDALFYAGWAGADAVAPAFAGTHLDAVLAESKARDLFGRYLDEIEAKAVAASPESREAFRVLRALGAPAWRSPSAVFVEPPTFADGKPTAKVAILVKAGASAQSIVDELTKLIAQAGPTPVPVHAAVVGNLAVFTIGYDDAAQAVVEGAPSLAKDATFERDAKRLVAKPAIAWSINVTQSLLAIEAAIASNDDSEGKTQAQKASAFIDASGLRGVSRYVSTSGFDGKDWVSASFVDAPAPRAGLLTICGDGAPAAALVKGVPADATSFATIKFDAAKALRELQGALGKADPEALKMFNMGVGAVYQAAGTNVLLNVLDPLGSDWAMYTSPMVGAGGLGGTVLVNQLDDEAKMKKGLVTASVNVANWLNIAVRQGTARDGTTPKFAIHGAKTNVGDVDVYYLATPILAPSWAIKDGRLYLGLFPQIVGAAARQAGKNGPSIADNPKYQALVKRLGAPADATTSYADLPTLASYGSWYPTILGIARYAGFGDLFGVTLPEPLLPPMDTLMANLAPAGGASWADDAGFHSKSITPFPGAALTTEQGSVVAAGGGGTALAMSILLPSLNRARETANRVKSASNLKQIGQGILLYSNEHRNKYPDDFATLLKTEDLVPVVFVSPRTKTDLPGDPAEAAAFVAEHADYVYLGKGLTNSVSAETIVAYEKPDEVEDGINILYGDGHVEFLEMNDAMTEIEKQKKARGIE